MLCAMMVCWQAHVVCCCCRRTQAMSAWPLQTLGTFLVQHKYKVAWQLLPLACCHPCLMLVLMLLFVAAPCTTRSALQHGVVGSSQQMGTHHGGGAPDV